MVAAFSLHFPAILQFPFFKPFEAKGGMKSGCKPAKRNAGRCVKKA